MPPVTPPRPFLDECIAPTPPNSPISPTRLSNDSSRPPTARALNRRLSPAQIAHIFLRLAIVMPVADYEPRVLDAIPEEPNEDIAHPDLHQNTVVPSQLARGRDDIAIHYENEEPPEDACESGMESAPTHSDDKTPLPLRKDHSITIMGPYLDVTSAMTVADDPTTLDVQLDVPTYPDPPAGPIRLAASPPRRLHTGMRIRENNLSGTIGRVTEWTRRTIVYSLNVHSVGSTHELRVPRCHASLRGWDWLLFVASYPWLAENLEGEIMHELPVSADHRA
ncbi:hypothetical protein IEO21_10993 [Rhodonia placenta]|uniref:Uncharacterized protein n=1 Tax=Rhodonia placenta TaxID=104341 RepID=A0A8H7NRN4_9APHY|nr:hypothetical protein IEO21_10993 [Postia placenta]